MLQSYLQCLYLAVYYPRRYLPSDDKLHLSESLPADSSKYENLLIIILSVIQEAQLSRKGRAMLHVTEYFAKSLKVIRSVRHV